MPMSIAAEVRAPMTQRPTQDPLRVLLVEDSPMIRERLIESISSLRGVAIVGCADNAAAALRILQLNACDVVVLDLQLHAGHGFNILAALKMAPERPQTTVVVLTSLASAAFRARSLSAGADYFFDKVFDYDRFTELLEQLAARRARNIGREPSAVTP
jgi:DNA-binding NarL/FixJ family response regulator